MSVPTIRLGSRTVGAGQPTMLIAEIGQAHDGSLGLAHSYIDAVAEAGADAVKFQTHLADVESTIDDEFRVKFSYEDATRLDYWRRMEFSVEQWRGLADHAAERGLLFLSTPFSLEAIAMLDQLDVPAIKIGSGEGADIAFVSAAAATGRPIILSTGMSSWAEIDAVLEPLIRSDHPAAVLQCTSRYPTAVEDVGLNVIDEMRERYAIPVGLSDHTGSLHPALATMARGAAIVEVHVAFSRAMFGPDSPSSLTMDELASLARARDAFHAIDSHPVDKDDVARSLAPMRRLFRRSVALREPLAAGTTLERHHLTLKKPGTGLAREELDGLVGRRLARDVPSDRLLRADDLE